MTYFAWPKEVQLVEVNRQNARAKLKALDQDSLSAIFFSGITPPASFRPVIRLGTDLTVVPMPLESSTP
jgi:hypothetical protein